jgi:uncharacterized membrane protein
MTADLHAVTKNQRQLSLARTAMVFGALGCLVLTPGFAMAYFRAYGYGIGERPPDWLAGRDWPTWFSAVSAPSTSNRYGVLFGISLAVAVVGTAVVVFRSASMRRSLGWKLTIGGLGSVAMGSLLEYGVPEDVLDAGYGFGLELLGFLSIAAGTVVLGRAAHRDGGAGVVHAVGIALVGPTAIVVGAAATGHLPSGPASGVLIVVLAIALAGLPGPYRSSS